MQSPQTKFRDRVWFDTSDTGDEGSFLDGVIFCVLCMVLVLTTILFGAVDQASWVLLTFVALLIAVLWLGKGWRERALPVNPCIVLLPLSGLILISVLQILPVFPSAGPVAEGFRATVSLDQYSTRFFIVRLVNYLVFFAAALTFVNNKVRLKKVVALIIGFGSLMAFFAILQRLGYPDTIYGIRDTPDAVPFGSFVNQHHFAAFMEMTGGVAFAYVFSPTITRDRRILLLCSAVVMGVAVVMTSSRGGLLSFVGTLLFAVCATLVTRFPDDSGDRSALTGKQKLAVFSGAIALVVVIFGVVLLLGADSSLLRGIGVGGGGDVSNGRLHFWTIAIQIFADHPLLGAGFDSFGVAFTKYDTWPGVFRVEQAHNDYLQILADAGIAGFACVAAFIFFLFRRGLASIMATGDRFRRAALIGALAGCFGILIHSFFDFPLRTPSNAFFFLMLSAIAAGEVRSKRRHRTLTERSR
jgi:O-antigen ligase